MVYVINKDGQPIMPTENHAKVRVLLSEKKAKVIRRCPFTIQLIYETENEVQEISLGIDAGSKHIGVSATTKDRVLYESEVELRRDITDLISTRRELRTSRRNRKTRYRQPRFNNRKRDNGWLAPSVRQKIDCHLKVVENVHKILPISRVIVETAAFDTQLLKAQEQSSQLPEGKDYQNGELKGWNTREYVLYRDNYTCRCCKGKSKDKILQVHHIESRKTGGNAVNNLVTLCKTCHEGYHKGLVKLPATIKRGNSYKDATFMGIMRWSFYEELKRRYPNVYMTYGYITKHVRIENNLPKEHYVDARCISGNPTAQSLGYYFYQKKIRCHNRQIHKCIVNKGGYRKLNQAPYEIYGYRLFDKVLLEGKEYFIFGRRKTGSFAIRTLIGETYNKSGSITFRKLKLVEKAKRYVTEKRQIA